MFNIEGVPPGKIWKYAQNEWERRFLLKRPPPEIEKYPRKEITDKYLSKTHLRVRKVSDGQSQQFKLTKKLTLTPGQKDRHWISTIYLQEDEYLILFALPGNVIRKNRYRAESREEAVIAIDQIRISDQFLWIAEVEFPDRSQMGAFHLPFEYEKEVTNDPFFAGNELAKRQSPNS